MLSSCRFFPLLLSLAITVNTTSVPLAHSNPKVVQTSNNLIFFKKKKKEPEYDFSLTFTCRASVAVGKTDPRDCNL